MCEPHNWEPVRSRPIDAIEDTNVLDHLVGVLLTQFVLMKNTSWKEVQKMKRWYMVKGWTRKYSLSQTRSIQRPIITPNRKTGILQLKISSGLQVIKDLLANSEVVFEACDHGACVNEIEWVAECPFVLCVVDLKLAVGWIACRS